MSINRFKTFASRPTIKFGVSPLSTAISYVAGGNTYPPAGARFQGNFFDYNALLTFTAQISDLPTDTTIAEYRWNLGGVEKIGNPVTYTFFAPGPKKIILTIIDSKGNRWSHGREIVIQGTGIRAGTTELNGLGGFSSKPNAIWRPSILLSGQSGLAPIGNIIPPTLVGSGAYTAGDNPTSLPAALPGGLQTNDIIIVVAGAEITNGADQISGISGGSGAWTNFITSNGGGNRGGLKFWWKKWIAGDPNPTVSFTGSSDSAITQAAAFRGCNLTNPIDVISATSTWGSQVNMGTILGITPGISNASVIVVGLRKDDWASVATLSGDGYSWQEIGEPSDPVPTQGGIGIAWDLARKAGAATAVTDKTFIVTGGADSGQGLMFSLKPV